MHVDERNSFYVVTQSKFLSSKKVSAMSTTLSSQGEQDRNWKDMHACLHVPWYLWWDIVCVVCTVLSHVLCTKRMPKCGKVGLC